MNKNEHQCKYSLDSPVKFNGVVITPVNLLGVHCDEIFELRFNLGVCTSAWYLNVVVTDWVWLFWALLCFAKAIWLL